MSTKQRMRPYHNGTATSKIAAAAIEPVAALGAE